MLAQIIEQVQSQIEHLVEQDLIEESYALYKEWEEHLNPKYSPVSYTSNHLTFGIIYTLQSHFLYITVANSFDSNYQSVSVSLQYLNLSHSSSLKLSLA